MSRSRKKVNDGKKPKEKLLCIDSCSSKPSFPESLSMYQSSSMLGGKWKRKIYDCFRMDRFVLALVHTLPVCLPVCLSGCLSASSPTSLFPSILADVFQSSIPGWLLSKSQFSFFSLSSFFMDPSCNWGPRLTLPKSITDSVTSFDVRTYADTK